MNPLDRVAIDLAITEIESEHRREDVAVDRETVSLCIRCSVFIVGIPPGSQLAAADSRLRSLLMRRTVGRLIVSSLKPFCEINL